MNATAFLLVAILLMCAASCHAGEPLIGFVNHFPWIDKGMDDVPKSGSNAVIFRAVSGMEAEEGKYDFSSLDRQIEFADKHKLKVILLLEANPVYAPGWLMEKCRAVGEMMLSYDGRPHTMPSMTSGVFKEWHEKFIRAVIAHVKERDTTGVVIGYQPGAEWWYESQARFGTGDIAAFRKWLSATYGSIDRLNATWRSDYKDFGSVDAPRLTGSELGAADYLSPFEPAEDIAHDVSWSIHQDVPIEAGREYVFRAKIRTEEVRGEGAYLQIAWRQGDNGTPIWTSNSDRLKGDGSWRQLEMTVKAPDRAKSAWLLLKLHGNGTVNFDDVFFGEKGSDQNLAPGLEAWFVDNWTQSAGLKTSSAKGCLTIEMPPAGGERAYGNPRAAAYDWFIFGAEFLGDYIERFCRFVKHEDPSRLTIGYLTYAFAFPVEWDYTQHTAMALDVILPKLKHMDVIGMQICSADGDPVRITAAIDLARKYGKPVYAVDVIDFTSGVAVGYPAMDDVTQEAIRHGASGVFYYCWWGTPDYDYYTGMPTADIESMVTHGRRVSAEEPSRVALIQPILPTVYTGARENDFRDFVGMYNAVTDSGIIPDIWTLHDLAEQRPDLRAKYDAVILADCAFSRLEVPGMLRDFMKHGGKLVTSGRLPEFDHIGNKLSARLEGAASLGGLGADYMGKVVRSTSAGNTPPLFRQVDDPGLQKRRDSLLNKLAGLLPVPPIIWDRETSPAGGFKAPVELRNGDILAARTEGVPSGGVSIFAYRSTDGGKTWSRFGEIVHSDEPHIDIGDGHLMQMRNGDVLHSYRRNLGREHKFRLEVAVSHDNGATWRPHSEVARASGEFRGLWSTFLPEKADGTLQCYYDDEDTPSRNGFHRHQWMTMRTWNPKSKAWGDPVTVSRAHNPDHLSRDGMCSVVELSKNKLFCAFETVQTYPPHRGMLMYVTSDDGGKTWSWQKQERGLLYQPPNPDFNALASWMIKLSTGDLLCVLTTDEDREKPGVAATAVMDQSLKYILSRDGGRTWSKAALVDPDHPIYFPGVCELKHGEHKRSVLVQYSGRTKLGRITGK